MGSLYGIAMFGACIQCSRHSALIGVELGLPGLKLWLMEFMVSPGALTA